MKIIKPTGIALLATAMIPALSTGCPNVQNIDGSQQPRQIDRVFVEESAVLAEAGDTFYHFASFSAGKTPVLKAMVTDTKDSDLLSWAAQGMFRLGSLAGTADLVGTDDSDNNSGIGINARAKSGNHTLGFALEKVVDASVPTVMSNVYARQRIPVRDGAFIEVTEGYADTNGDGQGIIALTYTSGNAIAGAGTRGNDNSRVSTAVVGRFNDENNPGFAARLWGRVDQDGNYFVDLTTATKGTFTRAPMAGMVSPDNGCLDPRLMDNRFDAHTYLWERGNRLILNIRHSETGSGTADLLDAVYHFQREGSVFVPRIHAGYTSGDAGDSGRLGFGGGFRNGYFDVIAEAAEGSKPSLTAIAGAGFRF